MKAEKETYIWNRILLNGGRDMKGYEKPVVLVNEELSEGVYAASGCYTVEASLHQELQNGRGDYRIQVNGKHTSDHTCDKQTLTVSFNMPVEYKSSTGTLVSAGTGTTIVVEYSYWNNPTDNIGLGDLVVVADPGLAITSIKLTDNH